VDERPQQSHLHELSSRPRPRQPTPRTGESLGGAGDVDAVAYPRQPIRRGQRRRRGSRWGRCVCVHVHRRLGGLRRLRGFRRSGRAR